MAVAIQNSGPTLAEQVHGEIKRDLLAGTFAPGSALLTRALLARYQCGISPLREALARLTGEGYLEASGHRGVRVPLPSLTDLNDLYRIRTLLECEALRLAMEHGDDHWEAQAVAACHRLERAPLPAGPPADRADAVVEWEARHRAFHFALVNAAPAPRLLRLIDQMMDQTDRYRAMRLTGGDNTKLSRDIVVEHRALLNAAVSRDGEATSLLADHLERTRAFVAGVLERGRSVVPHGG
jgi:GntR family transcriptional regulator, carbon starvation induced regulator